MAITSIILFMLVPILSFPIILTFYFIFNNNRGILLSILLGISIGIISYYFIPPSIYDLYRHHLKVDRLVGIDFFYFLKTINVFDIELMMFLINYIISCFNNHDLLQFFIVSVGYSILFYILYDYRKITKCRRVVFIILFFFVILGLNFIYFISGLWYYIAVIIFALSFYLEKIKKVNKKLCFSLYIFSILFHKSLVFALFLLVLYKMFGEKLSLKLIVISCVIFLIPQLVLQIIQNFINSSFILTIQSMYDSYITNDIQMYAHYSLHVRVIEISKIIITLIVVLFDKKDSEIRDINGYIILLSLCTLLMCFKSIVMIRFAMLIQFI